jgi:hypothetical protein
MSQYKLTSDDENSNLGRCLHRFLVVLVVVECEVVEIKLTLMINQHEARWLSSVGDRIISYQVLFHCISDSVKSENDSRKLKGKTPSLIDEMSWHDTRAEEEICRAADTPMPKAGFSPW